MTTTTARRRRSAKEKGGEDFELRWRLVGRSVGLRVLLLLVVDCLRRRM